MTRTQDDTASLPDLPRQCTFIAGVQTLDRLPPQGPAEIAFAGRSNVGKSSLLNAIVERRDLARVSNTPGRTQQLNFFDLGGLAWFVDMPGYGYARVSKAMRKSWDTLIFDYLRGRATLRVVCLLIDARHGLKDSDLEMMTLLDKAAVAYRIILTKADKERQDALSARIGEIEAALKTRPAAFPQTLVTSARKKDGIDALKGWIAEKISATSESPSS